MLPAPTTIATSTSCARTSLTWLAIRSICAGSVPKSRSPIRASPESFSRIRLKRAEAMTALLPPHLEAREAGDADVLAGLGGDLRAQVLDRLALVALLVEVLLVEQDKLGGPLAKLALDDLLHHVLGLAVGPRPLLQDAALAGDVLLGDVLEGDVLGIHRGDVDRHLARELLEILVSRHEVGLALNLDERALAAVGVDVGGDDALRGAASTALGGRGGALLAEDLDRLLLVALGLLESVLDVHHGSAGALPERLHLGSAHRHQEVPPLWVRAGSGAGLGCCWASDGCSACSGAGWEAPSAPWAAGCWAARSASCRAFSPASCRAFSSASCRAFSSASRRFRSSSSRRLRSSSSARRRASSSRHLAAAPSIAAPSVPITSSQDRIASSLPGIT